MCGRFALGIDHEDIFNQLRQDGLIPEDDDQEWIDREHFHPRYNIAPRSRAPVIRRRRRKDSNEEDLSVQQGGTNIGNMHAEPKKEAAVSAQLQSKTSVQTMVQTMRWGLVPAYANDDHPSQTANTINTRVETILQGPSMWLRLLGSKRCVILCDGYYEWLAKTSKLRVPHFIRNSDKSKKIYMAGLWDEVMFEGQSPLFTFSIVTVPAKPDMAWLHDRMPLIFSPNSKDDMDRLKLWLDPSKGFKSGIRDMLEQYMISAPSEGLLIYQVKQEVGKVGADSPSFIEPIDERKDGIRAMFAKSPNKASGASTSTSPSINASLKRSRSLTPEGERSMIQESPQKKVRPEDSLKKNERVTQSPITPKKTKPPTSPKKKKKKIEVSPSKSIKDFFPTTSPRKPSQTS